MEVYVLNAATRQATGPSLHPSQTYLVREIRKVERRHSECKNKKNVYM